MNNGGSSLWDAWPFANIIDEVAMITKIVEPMAYL